jgi:hypothetical protein
VSVSVSRGGGSATARTNGKRHLGGALAAIHLRGLRLTLENNYSAAGERRARKGLEKRRTFVEPLGAATGLVDMIEGSAAVISKALLVSVP